MRFTLALAALVAAASALPSGPQEHALATREDFVEDDFEIQAEPDDKKRQAVAGTRSVDWPEVSPPGGGRLWILSIYPFIDPHPLKPFVFNVYPHVCRRLC